MFVKLDNFAFIVLNIIVHVFDLDVIWKVKSGKSYIH